MDGPERSNLPRAPQDPAEFRRQATALFNKVPLILAVFVAGVTVIGWLVFGLWGLAIGLVLGTVFALAAYVVAGLLYAFSQDGA